MQLLKNPVKMHTVTKDVAVGTWGDFLFTKFISDIDLSVANQVSSALRQLSLSEPGIKLLTIVAEHASVPSSDARKVMAAAMDKVGIELSGTVFEGAGFRAGTIRGFITALYTVTRAKYPQKVCGSVQSCADWIVKTAKERSLTLDEDELMSALGIFLEKSVIPISLPVPRPY